MKLWYFTANPLQQSRSGCVIIHGDWHKNQLNKRRREKMSFRYGNREQITLFPQSVEEYVKDTDPVRAYDAIVESFDFFQLGIDLDTDKVGNPQYDPKAMLKLLLYGYSYGIRSSRKLERAIYHNISFTRP
jgi:transposase